MLKVTSIMYCDLNESGAGLPYAGARIVGRKMKYRLTLRNELKNI